MKVLILVVLDHALWHLAGKFLLLCRRVLILVVLDHALWLWNQMLCMLNLLTVLILVVLDHALWLKEQKNLAAQIAAGLNPCCAGPCSLTPQGTDEIVRQNVLILVVLDHALWLQKGAACGSDYVNVLILVVLDHALWLYLATSKGHFPKKS